MARRATTFEQASPTRNGEEEQSLSSPPRSAFEDLVVDAECAVVRPTPFDYYSSSPAPLEASVSSLEATATAHSHSGAIVLSSDVVVLEDDDEDDIHTCCCCCRPHRPRKSDWITKCFWFMASLLVVGGILLIFLWVRERKNASKMAPAGLPRFANNKYPPRLSLEEYYSVLLTHFGETRQVAGLQNPSTSVFEALEWMSFQDGQVWQLLDSKNNTALLDQRFVTAVFYFATAGAEFWDPDWLQVGVSECAYRGIVCGNDDTDGNIIEVQMRGQSLLGSLPSELVWGWPHLQRLDLSLNRLYGSLPSSWFDFRGEATKSSSWTTSLVEFHIGSNDLTGTLPSTLASFQKLQSFNLPYNLLQGSLPLALPSTLLHLGLEGNRYLSGPLPLSEWAAASAASTNPESSLALRTLDFGATSLQGTIPGPSLLDPAYRHLDSFTLFQTQLTGSVPSEIGALTNLVELGLSEVPGLTGTFPTEMYQLTNLQFLIMTGGQIEGPLDGGHVHLIGQLSNLRELQVTHSRLSGSLPSEIGLLTSLQRLQVAHTPMDGQLPTELGLLTELEALWLHGSGFTGTFPAQACALPVVQMAGDFRISCRVECDCCHYCY